MYFYSATTRGFYQRATHGADMPPDVCEVSTDEYGRLMEAPSQGRVIVPDRKGRPVVADAPGLGFEQQCAVERAWRDDMLLKACAVRDRHRDEQELSRPTTLTQDRFVELMRYIQKLRDWPQSPGFPIEGQRPVAPAWLAEQS